MKHKATDIETLDRVVYDGEDWVVVKILKDGDWKQLFVLMNHSLGYREVVIYNAESIEWIPE